MTLDDHQQVLGERLRGIRNQQGMTLQQVEERSGGRWKAAVIGAYERGDRAISAPKLIELADFYRIPVAELLSDPEWRGSGAPDPEGVTIDLTALEASEGERALTIGNYARDVQARRGDFNGRVLTLRSDDLRVLSAIFLTTPVELKERLRDEGLLSGSEDGSDDPQDGEHLEVLVRIDGEAARRRARIEPDGTLRVMSTQRST